MKKENISIVTGGGSGIGRALSVELAERGYTVYIIGRRKKQLEETKSINPKKIVCIQADVSSEQDRLKIKNSLPENAQIQFLIHNAAILGNIQDLASISLNEWQKVMATNVEAPLFLTQALLPRMHKTRILHVSSGAAHYPFKSWGAYCTSKAALHMLYKMFNADFQDIQIITGSVRPGVVDTDMQTFIRAAELEKHKHLQKFHDYYKKKELEDPKRVARFVYWILTGTNNDDFSAKEWNIHDEFHQKFWNN